MVIKIKEKLPEKQHPTPEEVINEVNKEIDAGTIGKDDPGNERGPEKEANPEKYPSHMIVDPGSGFSGTGALPGEWTKPPVIPTKAEQPFLFGEADQILNALETELTQWRSTFEKLHEARLRIDLKIDSAIERIDGLSSAITATRKHAPMKEDPSPPVQAGKIVDDLVADMKPGQEEKVLVAPKEQEKMFSRDDDPDPSASVIAVFKDTHEPGLKVHVEREEVAPGAAERVPSKDPLFTEQEEINIKPLLFRNPTQPIPEVLFPGDVIATNWETGPYRIEEISGPFNTTEDLQHGGVMSCPEHWSLKCSDVDAKRNKDGRLPKNYNYSYINLVVAVGARFLSLYAASEDEIMLTAQSLVYADPPKQTKEDAPQKEMIYPKITLTPSTEPSEEDLF